MWDFILNIGIDTVPFLLTYFALSAIAIVYLLFKRRTVSWFFTAIAAIVAGALIGFGALWLAVSVLNTFGGPVNTATWLWAPAVFGAIALAICNLWGSRWWRKLIAILAIALFALTATFAINAAYGLSPTLGSFLHISNAKPIDVNNPGPVSTEDPKQPLYETWQPPADMPKTGQIGAVQGGIPNSTSGFPARPAQIYLPPAAQTKDAPRLPLVIFMMGQPGDPDPQYIAKVLDAYAAKSNGLAPIALVVDQLTDPSKDPLCLDTSMGKAETYIMKDVVPWAVSTLGVLHGRQYWTVGGYSNGGQCASYFGSKYPETFGNILAVSPDEWPGAEQNDAILGSVFHGDQAAYDAVKPANIMAAKTPFTDTTAVFTVGAIDGAFAPGTQRLSAAAEKAGMHTTFYTVPDADHGVSALNGGLTKGFEVLYPRLGLSK